ncbi:MAG: hypothetical protein MHM6MM_002513 [Cercozoa sp. M6MM]
MAPHVSSHTRMCVDQASTHKRRVEKEVERVVFCVRQRSQDSSHGDDASSASLPKRSGGKYPGMESTRFYSSHGAQVRQKMAHQTARMVLQHMLLAAKLRRLVCCSVLRQCFHVLFWRTQARTENSLRQASAVAVSRRFVSQCAQSCKHWHQHSMSHRQARENVRYQRLTRLLLLQRQCVFQWRQHVRDNSAKRATCQALRMLQHVRHWTRVARTNKTSLAKAEIVASRTLLVVQKSVFDAMRVVQRGRTLKRLIKNEAMTSTLKSLEILRAVTARTGVRRETSRVTQVPLRTTLQQWQWQTLKQRVALQYRRNLLLPSYWHTWRVHAFALHRRNSKDLQTLTLVLKLWHSHSVCRRHARTAIEHVLAKRITKQRDRAKATALRNVIAHIACVRKQFQQVCHTTRRVAKSSALAGLKQSTAHEVSLDALVQAFAHGLKQTRAHMSQQRQYCAEAIALNTVNNVTREALLLWKERQQERSQCRQSILCAVHRDTRHKLRSALSALHNFTYVVADTEQQHSELLSRAQLRHNYAHKRALFTQWHEYATTKRTRQRRARLLTMRRQQRQHLALLHFVFATWTQKHQLSVKASHRVTQVRREFERNALRKVFTRWLRQSFLSSKTRHCFVGFMRFRAEGCLFRWRHVAQLRAMGSSARKQFTLRRQQRAFSIMLRLCRQNRALRKVNTRQRDRLSTAVVARHALKALHSGDKKHKAELSVADGFSRHILLGDALAVWRDWRQRTEQADKVALWHITSTQKRALLQWAGLLLLRRDICVCMSNVIDGSRRQQVSAALLALMRLSTGRQYAPHAESHNLEFADDKAAPPTSTFVDVDMHVGEHGRSITGSEGTSTVMSTSIQA